MRRPAPALLAAREAFSRLSLTFTPVPRVSLTVFCPLALNSGPGWARCRRYCCGAGAEPWRADEGFSAWGRSVNPPSREGLSGRVAPSCGAERFSSGRPFCGAAGWFFFAGGFSSGCAARDLFSVVCIPSPSRACICRAYVRSSKASSGENRREALSIRTSGLPVRVCRLLSL